MRDRWSKLAGDLGGDLRCPVDALEVSAVLESHGITQQLAQRRYQARDVFELGEQLFARLSSESHVGTDRTYGEGWTPAGSSVMLAGWIKIAATLVLATAIVALQMSPFWLLDQVITLALGLSSALVVSGGLSAVFTRRLLFYRERGNSASAFAWFRRSMWRLLACTAAASAAVSPVLALCVNYFFPTRADLASVLLFIGGAITVSLLGGAFLPGYGSLGLLLVSMTVMSNTALGGSIVFEYFVVFSLATIFWVLANTLYFLDAGHWLPIAVATGLLLYQMVGLILQGHWPSVRLSLSLGVILVWGTALLIMVWAIDRAFRAMAQLELDQHVVRSLAPWVATAKIYSGYLVFGSLYACLIVADHFLAWRGGSQGGLPLIARISIYETTSFLVLIPLILPLQLAEQVMRRFWEGIRHQPQESLSDLARKLYWRGLRRALGLLAISDLVVFTVFSYLVGLDAVTARFPMLMAIPPLLPLAMLAHLFLLWAGLNSLFLVSLSRLGAAIRSLVPAILIELALGLYLTQSVDFTASLVALAAGTATAALLSYRETRRLLADVGYYYFRCLLS